MRRREIITLFLLVLIVGLTFYINQYQRVISEWVNHHIYKHTSNPETRRSRSATPDVLASIPKYRFYRYELVPLTVSLKTSRQLRIEARVFYNERLVTSVGGLRKIRLRNSDVRQYQAHWPIPWNAKLGVYSAVVSLKNEDDDLITSVKLFFQIRRRTPPEISSGLNALLLEGPIESMKKLRGPHGEPPQPRNIERWCRHIGANAFLILGGKTHTGRARRGDVWDRYLLHSVERLRPVFKDSPVKLGVWMMSFSYESQGGADRRRRELKKLGYSPSLRFHSDSGRFIPSRHISLNSERRIKDMIAFAKRMSRYPEISYVGLDYIRCDGGDGYEMVDDWVRDMNIAVPDRWSRMSRQQKMLYMRRRLIPVSESNAYLEKWRWWQAHKTASIVNRVIHESGARKKFWVFTLSWQHGRHHGQDPYMMNDAGVHFNAVMLYIASRFQYNALLQQWKNYLPADHANIVVGQTIDASFLDSQRLTSPEEFRRRILTAYKRITYGDTCNGIFIHDLWRAFYGSRDGFTSTEWMITAAASISQSRFLQGAAPWGVRITALRQRGGGEVEVRFQADNQSKNHFNAIKMTIVDTSSVKSLSPPITSSLNSGEKKTFRLTARLSKRRHNVMVAVRMSRNNQYVYDFKILR